MWNPISVCDLGLALVSSFVASAPTSLSWTKSRFLCFLCSLKCHCSLGLSPAGEFEGTVSNGQFHPGAQGETESGQGRIFLVCLGPWGSLSFLRVFLEG